MSPRNIFSFTIAYETFVFYTDGSMQWWACNHGEQLQNCTACNSILCLEFYASSFCHSYSELVFNVHGALWSGPLVIVKGWRCRIKLEGFFPLVLITAFPIISSCMYIAGISSSLGLINRFDLRKILQLRNSEAKKKKKTFLSHAHTLTRLFS